MRTRHEVEAFEQDANAREITMGRVAYETAMYEGCVPELYWFTKASEVRHNREAFEGVVIPYKRNLKAAMANGYSLLLHGDNGTGKTMFISYILGRAVVRRLSVYYTTLMGFDADIKRGFGDREMEARLRMHMSADIVAIDELGKEQAKRDFIATHLEVYLKERYDNGYPVLLGSNLDYPEICRLYGPTIESMLEGRYQRIALEGGDFRKKSAAKMRSDMGYKG